MKVKYAVAWLKNGQWRTYSIEATEERAYQVSSELRMIGELSHVELCYFDSGKAVQS